MKLLKSSPEDLATKLFFYKSCKVQLAAYRRNLAYLPNTLRTFAVKRAFPAASSYILLLDHGRRLNSSVSDQANNRKFGRMLRRFCQYLFHMQYKHERIDIVISIHEFQTQSIDSGIDQRKPHHRTALVEKQFRSKILRATF